MSFLFKRGPTPPAQPTYSGLQIQTSVNVVPIAIILGTPRFAGNVIYGGKLHQLPTTNTGKQKGNATPPPTYQVNTIIALGEGAFAANPEQYITIFNGQYFNGFAPGGGYALAADTGELQVGGEVQGPYGWAGDFLPGIPNPFRDYKNIALLAITLLDCGQGATVPMYGFIVPGLYQGTFPLNATSIPSFIGGGAIYPDADPALCIQRILTHPRWGAMFPPQFLFGAAPGDANNGLQGSLFSSPQATNAAVGDSAVSTYCQAVGLGFSVALTAPESASSILSRWCKLLVMAPVWTGLNLKFIPYWDMPATNNPGQPIEPGYQLKYFTPLTTPLFDLTDDDILQTHEDSDPITFDIMDQADVHNIVRLDYKNINNFFNDEVMEAPDENSIELYGKRIDNMGLANEFTSKSYASISAQAQLQRNVSVTRTGAFRLSWEWFFLEPMDILTISDARLGLSRFPIRVTAMDEDADCCFTIKFEELPIGAAAPALYDRASSHGNNVPANPVPAAVNPPLFVEPGPALVDAETLYIALSGGTAGVADSNWGGCEVWLSTDNGATYDKIGEQLGPSLMGVLSASLDPYTGLNPDNTNVLHVSTAMSNAQLMSTSAGNAMAALPISVIVDANGGNMEFFSFKTATLTGANAYDLATLYRNLAGITSGAQHAAGARFAVLSNAVGGVGGIFAWPVPDALIGTKLFFKFLSFNTGRGQLQSLSTAVAYTFTPGARRIIEYGSGTQGRVGAQPNFAGVHVAWRSAAAGAKALAIVDAVNAVDGFPLSVSDCQGTASDGPITLTPASGTIMGQPTATIGSNFGSLRLRADRTNNDWVLG